MFEGSTAVRSLTSSPKKLILIQLVITEGIVITEGSVNHATYPAVCTKAVESTHGSALAAMGWHSFEAPAVQIG